MMLIASHVDESPLAILYSSHPDVLFSPFGSAELSWVPLHTVREKYIKNVKTKKR